MVGLLNQQPDMCRFQFPFRPPAQFFQRSFWVIGPAFLRIEQFDNALNGDAILQSAILLAKGAQQAKLCDRQAIHFAAVPAETIGYDGAVLLWIVSSIARYWIGSACRGIRAFNEREALPAIKLQQLQFTSELALYAWQLVGE